MLFAKWLPFLEYSKVLSSFFFDCFFDVAQAKLLSLHDMRYHEIRCGIPAKTVTVLAGLLIEQDCIFDLPTGTGSGLEAGVFLLGE